MKKRRLISGILALSLAFFSFSACTFLKEDSSSTSDGQSSAPASSADSGSSETPDDSSVPPDDSSSETPDDSSEKPDDSSVPPDDSSVPPDDSSVPPDDSSSETPDDSSGDTPPEDIVTDELEIHFLELGNKYTGDCTLIKVGDTEVLIDAGSRKNSAPTIKNYINKYCTDGVLEYVVATHAHQDHVAGFLGNRTNGVYNGIFYSYEIDTLIQFNKTNLSELTDKGNKTLYGEYLDSVEYVKEQGTTVYTALDCYNNANGASRSYTLGENVTMQILYQQFYEQTTSDENDYSVCLLLSQGEKNYLFTGDLEDRGEKSLVASNDLPECELFKGGHHGSPTSNTPELLSVIKPKIVCVCCCCGSDEYTSDIANMFPSQAFVDNVAPYTDKVYVTTVVADNANGYQSMNGNIVVYSDGKEITVNCSNNDILFKDTEWFKDNRTCPDAWK